MSYIYIGVYVSHGIRAQRSSPVDFVGIALIALIALILLTARHRSATF